jgi:hypothetical protein
LAIAVTNTWVDECNGDLTSIVIQALNAGQRSHALQAAGQIELEEVVRDVSGKPKKVKSSPT